MSAVILRSWARPGLEGRAAIVAAARGWIGTPYVHQASLRGAGCDCLGLVRGVWRELIGPEPEPPPPYTPDWAEARGRETLLEAAGRWLVTTPTGEARPGDVLAFRWRPDCPVKHLAIVVTPPSCGEGLGVGLRGVRIVHAYQNHAVQEVELPNAWRRRVAAAFTFPGLDPEGR